MCSWTLVPGQDLVPQEQSVSAYMQDLFTPGGGFDGRSGMSQVCESTDPSNWVDIPVDKHEEHNQVDIKTYEQRDNTESLQK